MPRAKPRADKSAETETALPSAEGATGSQTIKIKGLKVTVPAPYSEGHVMTSPEARALNQTLAENIRNNQAKVVEKAKETEGFDEAAVIAAVEAYALTYNFGMARPRKEPVDPVEKEEHKMAKAVVLEKLRARKIDLETFSDDQMDKAIAIVLGKYPEIHEEAVRRVNSRSAIASAVMDDLSDELGLGEAAPVE